MFVAFLGTGNALPTAERANTLLAVTPGPGAAVTLIDCGGDPFRGLARAGIAADRVGDLLLTHAHIDHLAGLPSLIESFRIAGRRRPLRIFAPAHALGVARDLLRVFGFELTLDRWPFAVELREIAAGEPFTVDSFTAEAINTDHAVPSVGFRLRDPAGGPIFAYTSDSRECPALREIARDAALVVMEATYPKEGAEFARQFYHLTITQAAEAATAGQAHALALVHLSTNHHQEQAAEREARQAFRGPVIVPRDGLILRLDGPRGAVSRLNRAEMP